MFTGQNCEYSMASSTNACSNVKCQNGGSCYVNINNQPICFCLPGYTGTMCDYNVNCLLGDTNINQCRSWSIMGFCNNMYLFNGLPIPVYCPISCRLCNLNCYDSATECFLWANLGFCNILIAQNNGICRRSCGQCSSGNSKILKVDQPIFNATVNSTFVESERNKLFDLLKQLKIEYSTETNTNGKLTTASGEPIKTNN
jgi:hypothetical protein